ncbi:MAG: alpha/beta fold hydrolase [bacterium]|nr:alpha/beta fold hydrolase [bacterium]
MSELSLKTIDDTTIFGDWHQVPGSSKAALLLHQRGRDHAMWKDFCGTLEKKGWNTLAIDLRGHGKSGGFGKKKDLKFDQFEDYHTMYYDITAAMDFLKRETPNGKFVVVGSSIGANLALAYAADHFEVKAAILLSPGLNYFGLRTDDVMVEYHRPLALITTKDDPSYPDAQKLIKEPGVQRANLWYQEFETGGHGVKIFEAHTELTGQIAEWMEKQIQ